MVGRGSGESMDHRVGDGWGWVGGQLLAIWGSPGGGAGGGASKGNFSGGLCWDGSRPVVVVVVVGDSN